MATLGCQFRIGVPQTIDDTAQFSESFQPADRRVPRIGLLENIVSEQMSMVRPHGDFMIAMVGALVPPELSDSHLRQTGNLQSRRTGSLCVQRTEVNLTPENSKTPSVSASTEILKLNNSLQDFRMGLASRDRASSDHARFAELHFFPAGLFHRSTCKANSAAKICC